MTLTQPQPRVGQNGGAAATLVVHRTQPLGSGNKMLEGTRHVFFPKYFKLDIILYKVLHGLLPHSTWDPSVLMSYLQRHACKEIRLCQVEIPGLNANLMFEQLALASFTRDYELRKPRSCCDRCNSSMSRT